MTDFAPPMNIEDEVLSFLLSAPTLAEIIAFKASDTAQQRLRYLLDANRTGTLTPEEAAELDVASNVNHFMMMLKIRARQKLS